MKQTWTDTLMRRTMLVVLAIQSRVLILFEGLMQSRLPKRVWISIQLRYLVRFYRTAWRRPL